jgi:hypothetical protein
MVEATAVVPEGRITPEDAVSQSPLSHLCTEKLMPVNNDRDYGKIRRLSL